MGEISTASMRCDDYAEKPAAGPKTGCVKCVTHESITECWR
jgi:hypothetical protein